MGYSGILGYGLLEIIFGKLILGFGIFWTVYFGIWDIAYPPNQASLTFSYTVIRKHRALSQPHKTDTITTFQLCCSGSGRFVFRSLSVVLGLQAIVGVTTMSCHDYRLFGKTRKTEHHLLFVIQITLNVKYSKT